MTSFNWKTPLIRLREQIWPPSCLHCRRLEPGTKWFCSHCLLGFEFEGRRTRRYGPYDAIASLYDPFGAPATLYRRMLRIDSVGQANLIASLMVVKYLRLGWPLPRLVLEGARRDRLVARAFKKIIGLDPTGDCVVVISLDQKELDDPGCSAIAYYPDPLLALSFLGSVSSYESAYGGSRPFRSASLSCSKSGAVSSGSCRQRKRRV